MQIDLDELEWMNIDEDSCMLLMGFSVIADINPTSKLIERGELEIVDPNMKYSAILNGFGHTRNELMEIYESDFTNMITPRLFPIIGQSNDLEELKSSVIKHLELQYHASKPSKSDVVNRLQKDEEMLSSLVMKYMNMFTIKNELN